MSFGLLALLAAGRAGPVLAGLPRLGLPLVVGEIAAGVLLDRTGLGIVEPDEPTTAFLAEVGFAMLDVRRRHPAAAARHRPAPDTAAVPVVLATGSVGPVLIGGGLVLLAGGAVFLLRSAPAS